MKSAIFLFLSLLISSVSWAGGSGSTSTGGTRPTRLSSHFDVQGADIVKFQHFNAGKVEFYFKDRNQKTPSLYEVNIEEIDTKYIDALKKSEMSQTWQIVLPENIEK